VVPHCIQGGVEGTTARVEEGSPPPTVVLIHQLEVAEQDGHLGAGHHQHNHHQEQEAEDVVNLVQPQRGHDEIQLDGDRAKGEHTSEQAGHHRVQVPLLLGDRAGDLVGAHREGHNFSVCEKNHNKETK